MNSLVAAVCGASVGLGLVRLRAIAASRRDSDVEMTPPPRMRSPRGISGRIIAVAVGLGIGALAAMITRWPILVILGGILGATSTRLWSIRGRHNHEQAVVEAIATWTEQMRDTLSAAAGLEHAVIATAGVAHGPLAQELVRLAEITRERGLSRGLEQFAVRIGHPTADFVAAALITAARFEARDLASLLGELATTARDEAALRRRVWVARARTRTASRMILAVIGLVVSGLVVLDPDYLAAYQGLEGQVVLGAILVTFAGSFVVMDRWGRIGMPERFGLRAPNGEGRS